MSISRRPEKADFRPSWMVSHMEAKKGAKLSLEQYARLDQVDIA
jgi:hypothetical protein